MRRYLYPQQNSWEIDATQIISDYLGTPVEAYDEEGQRVWARELDIYGRVRIEQGEVGLAPFLYQGHYLDTETGLAYNRFRYYFPRNRSIHQSRPYSS